MYLGEYNPFSEMEHRRQQHLCSREKKQKSTNEKQYKHTQHCIPEIKIIEYNPLWLYDVQKIDERESKREIEMNVLSRHHIFPRGSFVVKGFVNRKEYFIILNFESYATFLPKNLKKEISFEIVFYEEERDSQNEIQCLYAEDYFLDTNNYDSMREHLQNKKQLQNSAMKQQRQTMEKNTLIKKCTKSSIVFDVKMHNNFVRNDIEYEILYDSPNENIIMLGVNSLKHFSIYVDLQNKQLVIANSFHYFIQTATSYYIVASFVLFVVIWWLLIADFQNIYKIENRQKKSIFIAIMILLQIVVSIYVFVSIFILVRGKHYHSVAQIQHFITIIYVF